jgi:hypothetical protein
MVAPEDVACECPPRPDLLAAPGTPEPVSRFDVFEEMRRRGIPVAFPQGWDGRSVLASDSGGGVGLRPPVGAESGRQRPEDGGPLVPAFFDANQRRGPTSLDGRPILFPKFAVVASGGPPLAARSPGGGFVDCETSATTLRPSGSMAPCVVPALSAADTLGPPQLSGTMGGTRERPQTPAAAAAEARAAKDDAPKEPSEDRPAGAPRIRPSPLEKQPGVQPCAQGALAPERKEARGKGGGETAGIGVDFTGTGPCPCTCLCFPLGWIGSLFSTITGFVFDLRRLFRRDSSLFGIAWL